MLLYMWFLAAAAYCMLDPIMAFIVRPIYMATANVLRLVVSMRL